ncbi:unnamed protein product [Ilex paraguariensis]|uniref:DUF7953 domain-containing protein n=1 Tax=Ilex paraguariensis TaxID=185542 RepID=A0ABC8T6G1_9AQUA
MHMRWRVRSGVLILFLLCSLFLGWFPGFISAATVTLDSIEIFKTHELLSSEPTVYFHCKGENKTVLPDVKKKHALYAFKGEESWQPLTKLPDMKCKRCGFYEEDRIKSDDVFDEWEFCASDFTTPDGKYIHFKDKELNATFFCPECVPLGSDHTSGPNNGGGGMHWALVVVISALVSTVFVLGAVTAYKYWQRRKREQEQARFLRLFEDVDDMEDELGIGPLSNVI